MAITKNKKEEIIKKLEKDIGSASTVVFSNFHGINVADTSSLRRSLRNQGVNYLVAKKTLIKKTLADLGIAGDMPELAGEVSVAYSSDPMAPARGVYEFQKKLDGKISILGGIFDKHYKSKSEMEGIANIPTLQVLRGMFVNIINSPIQRFAVVLNQISEKK